MVPGSAAGALVRHVPVPDRLVEKLKDELEGQGPKSDVRHESNRDVSILMRVEAGTATSLSASGLAKGIKAVLKRCAMTMNDEDAKQLRKTGTHWFRHTHFTHALNGRPGEKESAVPVQVVQNNLGHASIGKTLGYLTTELDMRLAAMKGFGTRR